MAEIEDHLQKIMAMTLATRDVVVVVLANQVATTGDPAAALGRVSNGLSERIDDPRLADLGPEVLEAIRSEVDWIVSAAQKIINTRSKG